MVLKRIITVLSFSLLISILYVSAVTGNEDKQISPNKLVIYTYPDQAGDVISRHIYGHFAEHIGRVIYDGLWVGEDSPIPNTRGIRNDIVEALRKIRVPVIRWPGGCFADFYHWKDGIGPRDKRPKRIDAWGEIENNHFGTHEFIDFCEQIGCEPYICGNVGSGSPTEMRDWIEYITYDGSSTIADLRREYGMEQPWQLKFFGIGNEMWGSGGRMRPEFYADEYRRYQAYIKLRQPGIGILCKEKSD